MKSTLEYFEEISKIPRCSYEAEKMQEFLVLEAKKLHYDVEIDSFGNILCKKGKPKICLQSHYDMVCLGDAPNIELVKENNILKTKNSTLGADNGIGVSIMLYCMQKYNDLECLFTSDEEVGLIGATNLKLRIDAPNILNLDGEDEKEIYTGCAGGTDMQALLELEYESLPLEAKVYKAQVIGLRGGHSGIDIDKNIASSAKVISKFLSKFDCDLIELSAGERRNSIAKGATAIFTSEDIIESDDDHVVVERVQNIYSKKIKNSNKIIDSLHAFSQGVRSWNKEYGIPDNSANIGIVETKDDMAKIIISLRFMDDLRGDELSSETEAFFKVCGFSTAILSSHGAWTPNVGDFSNRVKNTISKYVPNAEFKAIHAGLECGILISTQKEEKEAISIGPIIRSPHSIREECDLDSVERIRSAVEEIISL
ncbi:MAG: Xaa-His dipeptidase [Sulfurospirillaceae bacterium]|nr:Xaa-His dipeptidase [Sulfurospirillaceae bacterium]